MNHIIRVNEVTTVKVCWIYTTICIICQVCPFVFVTLS